MKFRGFVAVPPDPEVSKHLERIADGIRCCDKKQEIRWVPRENFHLTIAFIGDILQVDAVRLESALRRSLANLDSFVVEGCEVTYFPFSAKPRLIAALLNRNQALDHLHRSTQAALREAGLPVESRAFVPHVTLGRVRHWRTPWLRVEPQPLSIRMDVREVSLMRSDRDENGARYTPVFTAGLSDGSV